MQGHHQNHHQHLSSSSATSSHGNFMNKDGYDIGEIDPSLFLYLDGQGHHDPPSTAPSPLHHHHTTQNLAMRPPTSTLNIFPSQPMHIEPPPSSTHNKEGNRKGLASSDHDIPKSSDPKTLRRLAQNREAARKSRLRKKAYVQQLESCRIKLTQLEQEIQRARSQGVFFGGSLIGGDQQQGGLPIGPGNISSAEAAVFDMEYARWLEEQQRLLNELRVATQEHLSENELRMFVDTCLAHYDHLINLKAMVAKTDVFHLISGAWKTPAERCFLWMGGFRPSEIIKVIVNQIEPLTEQQIVGICGLQQSTQEAEEALSQGLEALNQSLSDSIVSDSLPPASAPLPPHLSNFMSHMSLALNKLSALEGFVLQADNLRHQTIHRLNQLLTTRQEARCLLAVAEYFHRLQALSSLWLARPRQDG
ncbi:bZIP transcription factor family protein [Arabidopsis thaliana]|uniref:BZIP transcription factor family protein n=1 Tax=Arabidopsis thaliana TaxID=3702 RepID=A8MR34_ARATH|nr:bZIP transcription factor family protein [Arabidopsis thaliana]AED91073.1 bZIP transcription factor family protein [Arabidopsis thaliana]|eukprot:NP_001078538.1 bZIP transcription factor family protein [Arabidopsis thaliana]